MPAGTFKWIVGAVVVLALVLLLPAVAFAQDGEGGGDESSESVSVLELLKASGIIGFFIIALSFVATALIITNFVELKRDKLVPPDLIGEIEQLFDQPQQSLCIATDCFQVSSSLRRVFPAQQALERSEDDCQRCAEFMGHVRIELILGSCDVLDSSALPSDLVALLSEFPRAILNHRFEPGRAHGRRPRAQNDDARKRNGCCDDV